MIKVEITTQSYTHKGKYLFFDLVKEIHKWAKDNKIRIYLDYKYPALVQNTRVDRSIWKVDNTENAQFFKLVWDKWKHDSE